MKDANGRVVHKKDALLYKGDVYRPIVLVGLSYTYCRDDDSTIYELADFDMEGWDLDSYIDVGEVVVLSKEEYPEWYI